MFDIQFLSNRSLNPPSNPLTQRISRILRLLKSQQLIIGIPRLRMSTHPVRIQVTSQQILIRANARTTTLPDLFLGSVPDLQSIEVLDRPGPAGQLLNRTYQLVLRGSEGGNDQEAVRCLLGPAEDRGNGFADERVAGDVEGLVSGVEDASGLGGFVEA